MTILNIAEENQGWITFSYLKSKRPEFDNQIRFMKSINQMIQDGLCWEDDEPLYDHTTRVGVFTKSTEDKGKVFWFPTLMAGEEDDGEGV